MSGRNFVKSGVSLAITQGVVQGCAFLRNVLIARLITPADFGIAATFAMTFALLEMVSDLAADKLLIQADDGNVPSFQHTTQLVQASRGFLNALCLFLLASPVAYFFNVPQAKWAFRCIALVPLLKGFTHEDPNRLQREMKFRPIITVQVTSSILVTVLAVFLAFWLRDYSVMLWVLIAQVLFALLLSHAVAERPYRWAKDRQYARRIVMFGWPLLLNGVLMFVVFQGDRFIIGSAPRLFAGNKYTLTDLGIYSVAFSLTMAPASIIASVCTSLFLPLLSRLQYAQHRFHEGYIACVRVVSILAAMISIPVIVGGHWIILFIYGQKYIGAGTFIGWLAAMWALRILRVAPTLAGMAKSDTRNAMFSNMVRTIALVGVLIAVALGRPLSWVAVCGFIGEVFAMAVSVGRLARLHGVPYHLCLKPALFVFCGMSLAALASISGIAQVSWFMAFAISSVLMLTVLLGMLYVFPGFRRDVRGLIFRSESSLAAEV